MLESFIRGGEAIYPLGISVLMVCIKSSVMMVRSEIPKRGGMIDDN